MSVHLCEMTTRRCILMWVIRFYSVALYQVGLVPEGQQRCRRPASSHLLRIRSPEDIIDPFEVIRPRPDVVDRSLWGILDSIVIVLPQLFTMKMSMIPNRTEQTSPLEPRRTRSTV